MMPGFKAFYLDDPQLPEKVKKNCEAARREDNLL